MKTRQLGTVALVAMIAAAAPHLVWAQSVNEGPVLRVQGVAEIRVAPDLAVVRLGVANEAQTAEAAQRVVNDVSDAILDAVRDVGIDEEDIQTVRLVLSPVSSPPRPGDPQEPRIVGYRASNTVSVRVERLGLVAAVIDAALGAGANQLDGVSFGLESDQTVQQEALRRAVNEARGKAEAMAAALGVELGGILSVTEQPGFVREPMVEMSRVRALQSDVQTSVSPGEVAVNGSVSIEYRLTEQ